MINAVLFTATFVWLLVLTIRVAKVKHFFNVLINQYHNTFDIINKAKDEGWIPSDKNEREV